jgi:hypothetical protein
LLFQKVERSCSAVIGGAAHGWLSLGELITLADQDKRTMRLHVTDER